MKWILGLFLFACLTTATQIYFVNYGGYETKRDVYLRQFENDDNVAVAVRNIPRVLGHLETINFVAWSALAIVGLNHLSTKENANV